MLISYQLSLPLTQIIYNYPIWLFKRLETIKIHNNKERWGISDTDYIKVSIHIHVLLTALGSIVLEIHQG